MNEHMNPQADLAECDRRLEEIATELKAIEQRVNPLLQEQAHLRIIKGYLEGAFRRAQDAETQAQADQSETPDGQDEGKTPEGLRIVSE